MSEGARKLLDEALRLSDTERAELASEILASLHGPADADWDESWLAELDRRVAAAEQHGETGDSWCAVRKRIAARLAR